MSSSKFESLSGEVDLSFPEYDTPPAEPLGLAQEWLAQARARGVREPGALALATADKQGRASTRIVSVVSLNGQGLAFASHSSSQKGREMAATGWASGVLYWRETGQQVILSGPVTQFTDAESDTLWFGRPTPLHAMSVASDQSEPLADVAQLRARAAELGASGTQLPRPARWVGYRLEPETVEFWCADSNRLHRRLRYDRDGSGWHASRLQP